MFSYIDEYIDIYHSRFRFSAGEVVYVNQRWFPRWVVDVCRTPDIAGITVFADF